MSSASSSAERRLRFTDDQRGRLAARGRIVGRRRLGEFAGLVTPDTILRCLSTGRPLDRTPGGQVAVTEIVVGRQHPES